MEYLLVLQVVRLLLQVLKQSIHSLLLEHSQWLQAPHQYPTPHFFLTFYNMISISATLTTEKIDILAKQKGYQDAVQIPVEKEESYESYI